MIKLSNKDKRFEIINYSLLMIFLVIVLYPLWIIVVSSISSPSQVAAGNVWLWPIDFSLAGYEAVFSYKLIMSGFSNSGFLMIVGTVLCLIVSILGAYPLSRKDLAGKKVIMFLFTFTMFFGGGLIPFFILIKDLDLIDKLWGLILPSTINVWNIILMKTYFQTSIPGELFDAAKIDGSDDFTYLFRIVIPLTLPILAVLGLFSAAGFWNSYFNALIFINTPSKFTLQLVLRDILVMNQTNPTQIGVNLNGIKEQQDLIQSLKYAVIVVSTIPLLVIYPFVQRFFIKGLIVGSLKG